MIAAPLSIVAMSVSCPGESTKDTIRWSSPFTLWVLHISVFWYAAGSSSFGHL